MAAVALLSPGHEGRSYAMTGPERTTPAEQTRVLGELLGRELAFEEISEEEGVRSMMGFGISRQEAEHSVGSLRGDGSSPFATPTPLVGELVGGPLRTFRQWAAGHLDAFR